MATFPTLKTGAVVQYGSARGVEFQNQVLRFVDGEEQRYRDAAALLHRWTVPLTQLDEGELAALDVFFLENQGRNAGFAFTDPWDGAKYASCSLAGDQLELHTLAQMNGQATLTIVENRV